ncbi:hypothetical protein TELCIR_03660 [Teladorsagia circumcincta]|uniref:RNA-directed DNA polymerase n=1 Tax=Teladorsagia circumcincta TaxID=45464 RepID=A0A2G9UVQ5_TELCI|nr:hypothetical protein TELCIR_03660 [Teladorsagia circumcincta]
MDLSDAYMQLELEAASKKYTTINTHKGTIVYNRVPFGIASIPAIFQRIMETTLAGIEGVIIYLDDITVTAPDDAARLARLPDPREFPSPQMVVNEVAEKQMTAEAWKDMIFNEREVAKATQEGEALRKVYKYVMSGWPQKVKENYLKPYEKSKTEINKYKGCLMWGSRVVIPKKFRRRVLDVLHHSHYGRDRMIALARRKVWYPRIDKDIQRVAQSCDICATFGNEMRRTPLHPWKGQQGSGKDYIWIWRRPPTARDG